MKCVVTGQKFRRPKALGPLLMALWALAVTAEAKQSAANSKEIELGQRIYRQGILPSGKPLIGKRMGATVEGAAAACENCHRGSGMGSLEGNVVAAPIAGPFLFAKKGEGPLVVADARTVSSLNRAHDPYNETSFRRAMHDGITINDKKINPLMPQFDFKPAEIKALMAYLKQLSSQLSPGVNEDSIEFATIVTPGVDANQREMQQAMMQSVFVQRNSSQSVRSGQMKMPLDLIPRTPRAWKLTTWELQGAPETWGDQLQAFYKQKPVFAVIGGLSDTTWEPINSFCNRQKIPCLLPSVPVVPDQPGFYNLYYSHGVTLEAQVLAKHLRDIQDNPPKRLLQIYRDNEAGRAAIAASGKALEGSAIAVENRLLSGLEAAQIQEAMKDLGGQDQQVLWLNSDEVKAVAKVADKLDVAAAYVSGFLAKENYSGIPASWSNLRVIYPYELGEKRIKNLEALNQWLIIWNKTTVNEPQQAEVFFNMLFMTDLVSQMLDNLYRDYFVERAEDMLSLGSNVSPYPHLSLSRGQRYASKGAYLAKLGENGKLTPDSDWIVP